MSNTSQLKYLKELKQKFSKVEPNYCPTLGWIIFKRTYARRLTKIYNKSTQIWSEWLYDIELEEKKITQDTLNFLRKQGFVKERTEEFYEMVYRCIKSLIVDLKIPLSNKEIEQLYEGHMKSKINFSGRAFWQLGTRLIKEGYVDSLYNCHIMIMDDWKEFIEIFEQLMLGGGCGFNIQNKFISKLPKIKKPLIQLDNSINYKLQNIPYEVKENGGMLLNNYKTTYIVGDSRKGWVNLLFHILKSFFETEIDFNFNTTLIRKKGELIKGFGGVASGDKELVDGILKIIDILTNACGRQLKSLEIMDIICIIASIVISGNVRRSALLALGDKDDVEFLNSKRYDKEIIPFYRSFINISIAVDNKFNPHKDFFTSYYKDGESIGIVNQTANKFYYRTGLNKGVDRLQTKSPNDAFIQNRLDKNIDNILENKDMMIEPESNGVNPCLTYDVPIALADGRGFVPIGEIVKEGKDVPVYCKDDNGKITISMMRNPRKTQNNAEIYEIEINGNKFKIAKNSKILLINGKYKLVQNLKNTDLISAHVFNFYPNIGLKINSIKFIGNEDVYSGTVESYGNYYFGKFNINISNNNYIFSLNKKNCGEIFGIKCLLSELFLPNINSKEEFIEYSKLLFKVNKFISQGNFLYKKTGEKVRKNARVGISVSGLFQSWDKFKKWSDDTYRELYYYDTELVGQYKLPLSIKKTTIQPSGTKSLMNGVLPPLSYPYAKYMYRTIRMSSDDPLVELCKKHGCKVEDSIILTGFKTPLSRFKNKWVKKVNELILPLFKATGLSDEIIQTNENIKVVYFPLKAPENVPEAHTVSAIEHLEKVKKVQELWADNSVSCTVNFHKKELRKIFKWIKKNINDIKTVSLLPYTHEFKQAPYMRITEEEYNNAVMKFVPFTKKNLNNDNYIDSENLLEENTECKGGSCALR